MESPIIYTPGLFKHITFEQIDAALKWENYGAPRSESYYATKNIPYTYGRGTGERTYHPHVFENESPSVLIEIWNSLNDYELLFCNRYADQHQHLGWHADDSPAIDVTRPIAVVTFGAERDIWFKEQPNSPLGQATGVFPNPVEKLKLEHGSLLIMKAGMQQTHFHRIPKHDRPCGPRVSLTFRGLTPGFVSFEDLH
jgi:alkylated DNA repair dioxygenase AlkB